MTPPTRIVDLHTHLFNARCIPLAGVIANAIDKSAGESRFSRTLGAILNVLCRHEPSTSLLETNSTFRYDIDSSTAALDDFDVLLEQRLLSPITFNQARELFKLEPYASDAQQNMLSALQSDELYAMLATLESDLVQEANIAAEILRPMDLSSHLGWAKKVLRRALEWLNKEANRLAILVDEIPDYVTFLYQMLNSEAGLAHALVAGYKTGIPPIQMVHHMMDMQMAYVNLDTPAKMVEPKYDFIETQLDQMSQLQMQPPFAGQIKGFAAFDPRRDYPSVEDYVAQVKGKGFLGFKYYCAMGYLPIGNDKQDVENRVEQFFDACLKYDMAVFTHCTPTGFQTIDKYGLYANPDHWEKRLNRHPSLRLCFGHGGGGYDIYKYPGSKKQFISFGWEADTEEQWTHNNFANKVVELCTTYDNVYCDLAYLTAMIEGLPSYQVRAISMVKKNLLLASKVEGKRRFMDRVCYGSDWHMPSMVGHPRKYLDVFLIMFGGGDDTFKDVAECREGFFWRNAYEFLGLLKR